MKSKKIIIIDIDGVLIPFPKHFEKYVSDILGIKYTLCQIKQLPQYKILKYSYRISGIKRNLPILHKKIPKIISLWKVKYSIWIVSTRPMELSGIDTISWLNTNKIYYDELFFVNNKPQFVEKIGDNVFAIIDDDENNLAPFNKTKTKTILIKDYRDWSEISL